MTKNKDFQNSFIQKKLKVREFDAASDLIKWYNENRNKMVNVISITRDYEIFYEVWEK